MDSFYEVMDLPNYSTFDCIKQRYKELVIQLHPDKHANRENRKTLTEATLFANESFTRLNKAWKTLSDPNLKADYDTQLKQYEFEQQLNVNETLLVEELNVICGCESCLDNDVQCPTPQYMHTCRCGGEYIISNDNVNIINSIYIGCSNCSLLLQVDSS